MERGAATRDVVAKAVAGADNIEIKATIPDHQISEALKRFGLTSSNDEKRYIYFFDTPKLDLLGAGVIARARRVVGDAHDSTVKFRPINPKDVGQKWRKFPDFKIEADASETSMVKSASFSMPVLKGHIKRVAVGKRPIASIFTPQQEKFLESIAGHKIDFKSLVVLGPLIAERWKFQDPGCPWPITAELWKRGDGKRLMEASIKAPTAQAAAAMGGFMAFLAEVGAERDKGQQTKTRWALDYYVGKLAQPPAPKAAAAKKPPKASGKVPNKSAGKKSTSKTRRQPARKKAPAAKLPARKARKGS